MVRANPVGGLKRVAGEIVSSLEQVRASLEAVADGGRAPEDLSGAVDTLNGVRGVLAALQLTGPARLVEEMQQLCEGLSEGHVPDVGGASEALMLALIQLPDYLSHLQAGHPDLPLALLPAINDLRLSHGAAPLSEAELLVPTSVLADSELPAPDVQKALARVAGRVRPHFHRYLVQWFQPQTAREGLTNLGRLFHQLRNYVREGLFHELFLAAEAVIEALLDGSIPSDGHAKTLIGQLDRVIKRFAQDPAAWPEDEAQSQLVDLLSAISKSGSSAYLVTELCRVYGLEAAAPADEQGASLPSPEAIAMLIGEARKELLPIKDALDLYARGERGGTASLAELEPLVRNLANTLVVTGASAVVDRLRGCAETIGGVARGALAADTARLLAVAGELLAAEAELGEHGRGTSGPLGGEPYRRDLVADASAAIEQLAGVVLPQTGDEGASVPPQGPGAPILGEALAARGGGIDPELLEIFLEEALEEEQTIRDQYARWSRDKRDQLALTSLRRSFHTLKGSGRLVGAERVGELARAVEALLNRVIDHSLDVSPDLVGFVGEAVAYLPDLIEAEADGRPLDVGHMVDRVDALAATGAPGPAAGFTQSGMGMTGKVIPWPVPVRVATAPTAEGASPAATAPEEEWDEEAEAAEAAELADLADVDEALLDIFRAEARDHLGVLRETVTSGEYPGRQPDPLAMRALHTLTGSALMTGVDSFAAATSALERLMKRYREFGLAVQGADLALLSRALDSLELRLEHLPGGGGEIGALARIAREAEARIEQVGPAPAVHASGAVRLSEEGGQAEESAEDTLETPGLSPPGESIELKGTLPEADGAAAAILSEALLPVSEEAVEIEPPVPPAEMAAGRAKVLATAGAGEASAPAEAPSAQIQVRADLLDQLVDHSGEMSIYQSRLAQRAAEQGLRLEELDRKVARLREQLRQLETELQIGHGYERDVEAQGKARDVLEPLEPDRFSTLQRLSCSLVETVNDLVSLHNLLSDLKAESETLLLQQARIAEELQDGLLRTRMAPLAQLIPRLHRLVRETAEQLGKKARLEVAGADLQLDGSIQQRIAEPLEHLLRHAVEHGIEPPSVREAAGKNAEGVISLTLHREGNDGVVTVSDDGAGLDLQTIRRRAVERGLLAEDAEGGEEAAAQLVLATGFSTASEVAQIPGGGVGLDVVRAEVQQLSGSLKLETLYGRGTSFTIRLPLTLAVIDAVSV